MKNLEKKLRSYVDQVIEGYTPEEGSDWKGNVADLSDRIHENLPEELEEFAWNNYPGILEGASAPRAFGRALDALRCCEGMV